MGKYLLLTFALVACSSHKEEKQRISYSNASVDNKWSVYEGTIITDKGLKVKAALSLTHAIEGVEGLFKIKKTIEKDGAIGDDDLEGKYWVSFAVPNQEQGVTLIFSSEPKTSQHAYPVDKESARFAQKLLTKRAELSALLATKELFFKTEGSEILIQTDKSFKVKGTRCILYKRSDLFTVEGYLTFESDTLTSFFERNTLEKWQVFSLGELNLAKQRCIELGIEKGESAYLKGVAYSVSDTTSQTGRSLVLKRLIKMEKPN
ncbi:MAG TPA: hypothetical protein VL728_01240 [Cyclobacteriaceae bacterium]|nr:hypothetical protein [Cyclobacteriaceae bacterium]